MKTFTIKDSGKKMIGTALVALFWVLLWTVIYIAVGKEVLVPSPKGVALRFFELSTTTKFWETLAISCGRVAVGFVAALATGIVMGVASSRFWIIHRIFAPILRIITTTPVASFIILAVTWISSKGLPIFIVFLMVVPIVWNNIYQGINNVDKSLLEMTRIYRLSTAKKIKAFYIPSLMPYISASFSTGIGFAWKAGVAAEVIALPKFSVGKEIYNAKVYLKTTDLFAWTIAAIILSFALEKIGFVILKSLKNRVYRGKEYGVGNTTL